MQVGWSCDHPTCIVVPERQPGKKKTEAHTPVRKSQHRRGSFFQHCRVRAHVLHSARFAPPLFVTRPNTLGFTGSTGSTDWSQPTHCLGHSHAHPVYRMYPARRSIYSQPPKKAVGKVIVSCALRGQHPQPMPARSRGCTNGHKTPSDARSGARRFAATARTCSQCCES